MSPRVRTALLAGCAAVALLVAPRSLRAAADGLESARALRVVHGAEAERERGPADEDADAYAAREGGAGRAPGRGM